MIRTGYSSRSRIRFNFEQIYSMDMSDIIHLGDFKRTISVYLIDANKKALIDPGMYSATDDVLNALRAKGFRYEEIDYIILTHLHMDHSGNSWALLKHMPNAKVIIHNKAVKYLVDPEPLVRSSREVLGSIVDLWGGMEPISKDRIIGIDDNSTLMLNDSMLKFIATPGHAPYHLSIIYDDNLFSGDALGIKAFNTLRPASPLPSFRLDLALQSIDKIKGLNAKSIYMPHFGISKEPNNTINDNLRIYNGWARIIKEAIDDDLDEDQILELLVDRFKEYKRLIEDDYYSRLLRSDLKGFIKYMKKNK